MSDDLRALAAELGVEPGYHDTAGQWRSPGVDGLRALVGVLGWPVHHDADAAAALAELRAERERRVVDPVVVVAEGRPLDLAVASSPSAVELVGEDGASRPVTTAGGVVRSEPLEVGYHRLRLQVGADDVEATVIVAPPTVRHHPADAREWGVFAPLHALGEHPVLADLDRLGAWAGRLGASVVATLPLLATFSWDPSPYQPISRSLWSDRYLERAADGLGDPHHALAPGPPPSEHAGQASAVRRTLAEWGLWGEDWEPVVRWAEAHPEVVDAARFVAAAEHVGGGWRHPDFDVLAGAGAPASERAAVVVGQHRAHRQLGEVADALRARGQRLYLDLPLGCHPDGFDTFVAPELYAVGASAGAPPDDFFSGGQNWGFPPVLAEAARAEGYRTLRRDLAHHMAVAGMLRIDHVMQVERLFWIPDGAPSAEGAYVRAPREELLAVLAVESWRHDCIVVGEDLGTVPPAVGDAMDRWSMSGMWVAEFSVGSGPGDELDLPGPGRVASVDTHDTPTFAGWRRSHDLDLLEALELLEPHRAAENRAARHQQVENLLGWLAARGHLAQGDAAEAVDVDVHAALVEAIGGSAAAVVLVTLEDLWGELEPQNVPGTPADRPNWVQRSAVPLDRLDGQRGAAAALARLDRARADARRAAVDDPGPGAAGHGSPEDVGGWRS